MSVGERAEMITKYGTVTVDACIPEVDRIAIDRFSFYFDEGVDVDCWYLAKLEMNGPSRNYRRLRL